jgi:hypothetical protein
MRAMTDIIFYKWSSFSIGSFGDKIPAFTIERITVVICIDFKPLIVASFSVGSRSSETGFVTF